MARPISLELPPRDPRRSCASAWRSSHRTRRSAARLLRTAAAVARHGVFQLLRGALGASDKLVETAVDAAKSDESVRAMRNAIILGKMLGSINPEVLQCVATAVGETLGCYQKPVIEPPGLFSLLSQFRHKELRRSIALINRFLEDSRQSDQIAGKLQINRALNSLKLQPWRDACRIRIAGDSQQRAF
jgi:uncharacterized protein YjgD (DUF1641 family)